MLKWLFALWDRTNRRSDMQILWPVCRDQAPTLDHAKAAFMFHVMNDPAWTNHYSEQEIVEFIEQLK